MTNQIDIPEGHVAQDAEVNGPYGESHPQGAERLRDQEEGYHQHAENGHHYILDLKLGILLGLL